MSKIFDKLFVGKKPPDEIIVMARLNELKDLILEIFKITKITKVRAVYKINILADCFKVSEVLNDKYFLMHLHLLNENNNQLIIYAMFWNRTH